MTNPRNPFRINVGFIIHEEVGYSHKFPFEYEKAVLGEDLTLDHFDGLLIIDRTPQGLVARGEFSGDTNLECVRCLKETTYSLHGELTELFAFKERSLSESGLLVPEDGHIDFTPILREYALLEVPIKSLCKPDCKGLCIECGQDLNEGDCGHDKHEDESPFKILKNKYKL